MILPEMARDLHLSYIQIGTVTGVGQTAVFFSIPLAGFLTPRIGGLKLIVGIQFIGAGLLTGLAAVKGFKSFFIFYFFIRAWPIMIWIPLISVAIDYIPIRWRATMLTLASSAACFFILVDGQISSFFIKHLNWRALWLCMALICLASSLFSWIALKYAGAWRTIPPSRAGKNNPDFLKLRSWLKSRDGIVLNLIFLITGFSFTTFQLYLAPYLRDELGIGISTTALMWSFMGISGAVGGVALSLFTERIGVRLTQALIFFSGLGATGFLLFSTAVPSLMAMAFFFGTSQAAIYGMGPAYISKVMAAQPAARVFTIGTMILASGALFGNFIGGWHRSITHTFGWGYMVCAVLFACGALLSLVLTPENQYLKNNRL